MKNKKQILTIAALEIVVLVLFSPNLVQAGWILDGVGISALKTILEFINFVIGFCAGVLFQIGGALIGFALLINYDILNNSLVTIGWQITRDFANLGLVFFIIIISIATILRFEQYGAKSTLAKLIAVALLVNFSLVGAGIFIDFSNMLTNFFIGRISSVGPQGLGTVLASVFKIQNLLETTAAENNIAGWGTVTANSLQAALIGIASICFVSIFTLLGAFSLLALAIMLLIRSIAVAILLVLSPLACLAWILPGTKKQWEEWWQNFMKWIIFAPAASFFLYLSVAMAINYSVAIKLAASTAQGVGPDKITFNLMVEDPLAKIGNLIIIIGFMLGGLMAANSMGITGAKTFLGVAQNAGKWAQGAITRTPGVVAQRALSGGVKKDEKTGEVTTTGQRIATTLSRIPGFRGVANRISNVSAPQAKTEEVEKYRKDNVANLSNDALIGQMTTPGAFINPISAAAMFQEAAKRNLTGDARLGSTLNRYLNTSQAMGTTKTILTSRPDLAPIIDKSPGAIEKVMKKISANKTEEIGHEAFENEDVILSLNNSHLERLGRAGEARQRDNVIKVITKNMTQDLISIQKARETLDSVKQKIENVKDQVIANPKDQSKKDLLEAYISGRDKLITEEKSLTSSLNTKDKKILELHTFINQNPNWQT